jgi:hypothetical protein
VGGLRAERGEADSDVRRTLGRAIADALARAGDDGLPSRHADLPLGRIEVESPLENDGELVEVMCAIDTAASPEATWPTYSSMVLPPGTGMRTGASMISAMGLLRRAGVSGSDDS